MGSSEFKVNANLEKDLMKQLHENATPQYEAILAKIVCPDHAESPTIEPTD